MRSGTSNPPVSKENEILSLASFIGSVPMKRQINTDTLHKAQAMPNI
ncbi:hypothetical protein [Alteromonas abrolhosensis]